jgi:hypothetical protein
MKPIRMIGLITAIAIHLTTCAALAQDPVLAAFQAVTKQRYMAGGASTEYGNLAKLLQTKPCRSIAKYADYDNLPVEDCLYFFKSARPLVDGGARAVPAGKAETWMGRVIMLNASAATLTKWAEIACARAKRERVSCGTQIAAAVADKSGAQFPIAGIVIEKDKAIGGSADGHVSVFFKDGVTVHTDLSRKLAAAPEPTGKSLPGRQLSHDELETVLPDLTSPSPAGLTVQQYARIIATSAECYQRHRKPQPPVWVDGKQTAGWLRETKKAYLEAIKSPENGYVMFDLFADGKCT